MRALAAILFGFTLLALLMLGSCDVFVPPEDATGTPTAEDIRGGIGILAATDTPTPAATPARACVVNHITSTACLTTGEHAFASGSIHCWNPYTVQDPGENELYVGTCCLSDNEVDEGYMYGVVITPSDTILVDAVQVHVAVESGSSAGDELTVRVYNAGTLGSAPGSLVGETSDMQGDVSTSSWEIRDATWVEVWTPITGTFGTPLSLTGGSGYWVLAHSDDNPGGPSSNYKVYQTYCRSSPGSGDSDPYFIPGWTTYGLWCEFDGTWACDKQDGPSQYNQVPVALFGATATPTPTPTNTPLPEAYIIEVSASMDVTPTVASTHINWNLRSGVGVNDEFVEVYCPSQISLAGYQLIGSGDHLYVYAADNLCTKLQVIWCDEFPDCGDNGFPASGTFTLTNASGDTVDVRTYPTMAVSGNSWAADVYTAPLGSWSEHFPSPGTFLTPTPTP